MKIRSSLIFTQFSPKWKSFHHLDDYRKCKKEILSLISFYGVRYVFIYLFISTRYHFNIIENILTEKIEGKELSKIMRNLHCYHFSYFLMLKSPKMDLPNSLVVDLKSMKLVIINPRDHHGNGATLLLQSNFLRLLALKNVKSFL